MTRSEVLSKMRAGTFTKDETSQADDIPMAGDFGEAVDAVRLVVDGCNLSAEDYDLLESALSFLEDLEMAYRGVAADIGY